MIKTLFNYLTELSSVQSLDKIKTNYNQYILFRNMESIKSMQLRQIVCQYFTEENLKQQAVKDSKKIIQVIRRLLFQSQIANGKCFEANSICSDILKVISISSQSMVGHLHPASHSIFRYVLKKIRQTKIFKQVIKPEEISLNSIKSEKFTQETSIKNAQIGDLLKPENMIKGSSIKHPLSSLDELCCQPIFNENVPISKASCKSNIFFYLNDVAIEGQSNFLALSKFICSVCNEGGGSIFFGFQCLGNMVVPKGFSTKESQTIAEIQNKIRLAANIIKPGCELQFHRVPIRLKNNGINICLKALIIPASSKKMSFIQLSQNFASNTKTNEIYEFGPTGQPTLKKSNLYSLVYRLKDKKQRSSIYHQGSIKCNKPLVQCLNLPVTQQKPAVNQNEKDQQKEKKQLDKKFCHKSLLIVEQQKENRFIQQYEDIIKNSKVQYFLKKPFEDVFKFKGRSVWMICHNVNFAFLKNILKFHEQQKTIDSGKITMMPIYKNLEIEKNKLSTKNKMTIQSQLKKYFATGYGENEYEVIDKNKVCKKMVEFSFETEWQSLFGYMLFQALKLRPYFTKNGNIFKVGENMKVQL